MLQLTRRAIRKDMLARAHTLHDSKIRADIVATPRRYFSGDKGVEVTLTHTVLSDSSGQLLQQAPSEFAKSLQALGTRRCYFVWDFSKGAFVASHPELQPMADYLANDNRDFKQHEVQSNTTHSTESHSRLSSWKWEKRRVLFTQVIFSPPDVLLTRVKRSFTRLCVVKLLEGYLNCAHSINQHIRFDSGSIQRWMI